MYIRQAHPQTPFLTLCIIPGTLNSERSLETFVALLCDCPQHSGGTSALRGGWSLDESTHLFDNQQSGELKRDKNLLEVIQSVHDRIRHIGRLREPAYAESLRQPLPRKAAGSRQERPDCKWKQKEPETGQSGVGFRSRFPELQLTFILPICVGFSEQGFGESHWAYLLPAGAGILRLSKSHRAHPPGHERCFLQPKPVLALPASMNCTQSLFQEQHNPAAPASDWEPDCFTVSYPGHGLWNN